MTLLSVQNLKVRFDLPDGEVKAVNDINLDLNEGACLGIVGESGSGKTQFVLSMMGLLAKNASVKGSIKFDGVEIVGAKPKTLADLRGNDISMIFQDPMTSLNPYLTIERQMTEVLQVHQGLSRSQATQKALEALELVEIPEAKERLTHYPHQMSGGMRQRVMIAMSLLCKPKLLIADEPTTALDVTVQAQILDLLRRIQKEVNTAIIMITHNLGVVANLCEDVVVMYGGRIIEQGQVNQILKDPRHPYTQGLLRSMPRLNQARGKLQAIPGQPPNLQKLPKGCAFEPRCDKVEPCCKDNLPTLHTLPDNSRYACFYAEKQDPGIIASS